MAERRDAAAGEVVCPHCKKTFRPELLAGTASRHRGYKCPHCRLFVASDRADAAEAQAGGS